MDAYDLAELDVIRGLPNEVLSAQGIVDFIDGMYMHYEDDYGTELDIPEIVMTVAGSPVIFSEALNKPKCRFMINSVRYDSEEKWRVCYIEAEYAE